MNFKGRFKILKESNFQSNLLSSEPSTKYFALKASKDNVKAWKMGLLVRKNSIVCALEPKKICTVMSVFNSLWLKQTDSFHFLIKNKQLRAEKKIKRG